MMLVMIIIMIEGDDHLINTLNYNLTAIDGDWKAKGCDNDVKFVARRKGKMTTK